MRVCYFGHEGFLASLRGEVMQGPELTPQVKPPHNAPPGRGPFFFSDAFRLFTHFELFNDSPI